MIKNIILPLLIFLCVGVFFKILSADAFEGQSSFSDAQIKAAYIIKIKDFILWPDQRSKNTICIIGDDLVGTSLAFILRKNQNKQNLKIEKASRISEFDKCLILFIGKYEDTYIEQTLNTIRNKSILTVSDSELFIDKGGMVGLVYKNNRVRIEINKTAAEDVNIRFSSKILEISDRLIE